MTVDVPTTTPTNRPKSEITMGRLAGTLSAVLIGAALVLASAFVAVAKASNDEEPVIVPQLGIMAFSPHRLDVASELGHLLVLNRSGRIDIIAEADSAEPIVLNSIQTNSISAAISPDGRHIATGARDGTITIFNIKGDVVAKPETGDVRGIFDITFAPGGDYFVTAGSGGVVRRWDLRGNLLSASPKLHRAEIVTLAVSPDSTTIASGAFDGSVQLSDLEGKSNGKTMRPHQGRVNSVAFSPDGKSLLTAGDDRYVHLLDLDGEDRFEPIRQFDVISEAAFSHNGELIVTAGFGRERSLRYWNLEGEEVARPFRAGANGFHDLVLHTDGRTIFASTTDGALAVAQLGFDQLQEPITAHERSVTAISIGPRNGEIVSGDEGGTINIHASDGRLLVEDVQVMSGSIADIVFARSGFAFLAGGADRALRIWNLTDGVGHSIGNHPVGVLSVAVAPNGRTIVSGGLDGVIRSWVADGIGSPLFSTPQYETYVPDLAFSHDSQLLASAHAGIGSNNAGAIRLWVTDDWELSRTLRIQGVSPGSIDFAADGRTLVAGYEDGSIGIWGTDG